MRIRFRSVPDLMPYGAPELRASARPLLARGVLVGSTLWSSVFLVLLATGVLRIARPPEVVIPFTGPPEHEVDNTRVAKVPPPVASPPALRPVPRAEQGVPSSVPQVPVPRLEAAPLEPGGSGVAGEAAPGAAAGSGIARDRGPPPAPREPVVYEIGDVDELPIARSIVKPIYSDIARDAQVEGLVVVRALVDAEGRVDRVQIEQSIPLLDDGAMEAARRFRFTPARRAGRPVAVWVRLPFRFVLHGSF